MSEDMKQIPKQQDRLEKSIAGLHSMIGELDSTLSPLMTVATPSPSDETAKAESLVDYAAFIRKMADSTDLATEKIKNIRARLQI